MKFLTSILAAYIGRPFTNEEMAVGLIAFCGSVVIAFIQNGKEKLKLPSFVVGVVMVILALVVMLLTGCVSIPPVPPKGTDTDFAQRFPPMPPVANNATTQESLIVQAAQPSQFTGNIYISYSTNETCHWEAIQGSDDGKVWTNECVFLTADDVVTNVTFTNSTPQHYWRYVFRP